MIKKNISHYKVLEKQSAFVGTGGAGGLQYSKNIIAWSREAGGLHTEDDIIAWSRRAIEEGDR